MAKGDDIEERLIDFAVEIIQLCDRLPPSHSGRHISGQLLRSGTAPAAHYSEARGAESTNDFIHKLKLCLKELNESRVWLRIINRSKMLDSPEILQECSELARIINANITTTRAKQK